MVESRPLVLKIIGYYYLLYYLQDGLHESKIFTHILNSF